MCERLVCIYCMEAKLSAEYGKTEHVLPQAFGRFNENLTLNGVVCDECNSHFGQTVDLELARGSIDGLDRFRFRLKPATRFEHLGRRTARVDRLHGGPMAGALLTWTADPEGQLASTPLPQIGFRRRDSDERVWFRLDELPTVTAAAEMGLLTEDAVSQGLDYDELAKLDAVLAARGGGIEVLGTAPPAGAHGGVRIETTQTFGAQFFRAIAKIGLNYVASQFGAQMARGAAFDIIRRYVLYGEKLFDGWFAVYRRAPDSPEGGLVHIIGTCWDAREKCLRARVSLHNQRVYEIRLSSSELLLGESMERYHMFDLVRRRVRRIYS